jgi:hypothetical protein
MRWLVAVLTGLVLLTGCVGPATTGSAYRDDASKAVDSALSEAVTAHIMITQVLADRTINTYADVVLTGNETAIGPIQDSFGSVQPPRPSDDVLRDEVLAMLGDEEDALASARIAVRRSDTHALAQADKDLADLIKLLTQAQQRLR